MARTAALWMVSLSVIVAVPAGRAADYARSVVRVNATAQGWNVRQPWQKGATSRSRSFGVVLNDCRVLVQGTTVADAAFIELERLGSGAKSQARVVAVDYLANLALLACDDSAFLDGTKPVSLIDKLKVGASCEVVQFQSNDEMELSPAVLKSAEVGPDPANVKSFLSYRLKVDLGGNFSSKMAPVFRRGKLAGLLVGYGEAQKIGVVIPAPVIQHFLADLDDGSYEGFPSAGFGSVALLDPALRRFLRMADGQSGVYVNTVRPGGSAAAAGLLVGDVITAIDRYDVDKRGEYRDPDYGRIPLSHLLGCRRFVGDTIQVHIVRDGEPQVVPLVLQADDVSTWPVPPFVYDQPLPYLVFGGLVFQELDRPFLQAWGGEWEKAAPRNLVRLLRKQWDLAAPGGKFVILPTIFPTPFTSGYENVGMKQVVRVNGRPVGGLADVAAALEQPLDGYHHVEFDGNAPAKLVLAADAIPQVDAEVRKNYFLPSLRFIPDRP